MFGALSISHSALLDNGCIVVRRVFEQKETKETKSLGRASAYFGNLPVAEKILTVRCLVHLLAAAL